MKIIKGAKIESQLCLENQDTISFVNGLGQGIQVKSLVWRGTYMGKWKKLLVPKYLQKLGVTYCAEAGVRTSVQGTFKTMSKADIIKTLTRIAKNYGLDKDRFRISTVVVTWGDEELKFKRMSKSKKEEGDKRRKVKVLGHVNKNSKPILNYSANGHQDIWDRLHPFKFACQVMKEEKRVVVCSEVK